MEDGQVATTNPGQDVAAPSQAQPGVETQSQDQSQTVDYQKRFADTQAAFTRNQQELAEQRRITAELQSKLQEIAPYYEQQKKFFSPEEKAAKSAWDYENGIDGALTERDQKINNLEQKLENALQGLQSQSTWAVQQQFKQDQYRLYDELGKNDFGSEADFAEVIKQLPNYDPNWESNYLQRPSYETLKRSYFLMSGAARYDPNSAFARQAEAKQKQDFLNKQSNYLGSGQSIKYGPSATNPNSAYMTPIESV